MADDGYCEEKLRNAVDALATSAEPIQERLFTAAIALHVLSPEDFSDEGLRKTFGALEDMVTWRVADADEGTLRATTGSLSDEQASAAATMIFRLYVGLTLRR